MKTLIPIQFLVGLLFVCTFQISNAHGDLHKRILDLTIQIDAHTDSAILYLKRGDLRLQHETYSSALRDFETCLELGLISSQVYVGLAKCHLNLKEPEKALGYVDKVLSHESNDFMALQLKGLILKDMDQHEQAARYFEQVILHADELSAEYYMQAAQAWQIDKTTSGYVNAERILLLGIEELGDLYLFHQEFVELYRSQGAFDKALSYQTLIIKRSVRKEHPYYQRGLINLESGNFQAAREDFENANQAIKQLPDRLRTTISSQSLQENISLVNQQLD